MKRGNLIPAHPEDERDIQDVRHQDGCSATMEGLFCFSEECVNARKLASLTRKDVAERMNTTPSAIARLETFMPGRKHAPTLNTLLRYAQAMGCRLIVKLEPRENNK